MNLERNSIDVKKYSRRKLLGLAASAATATVITAACGVEEGGEERIVAQSEPIALSPSTDTPTHSEAVSSLIRDLVPSRFSIPSIYLQDISVNKTQLDTKKDHAVPLVPDHGVVTPDFKITSMQNKIWIFGHSSWKGVRQDLFSLQDVNKGDEVIVDVQERDTDKRYDNVKFTIQELVITDMDGGSAILNSREAPIFPSLVMQTSIREDGVGKRWILDRDLLMSKARVLINGNIDDPSKYLLLFVNGLIRFDQISRLQG